MISTNVTERVLKRDRMIVIVGLVVVVVVSWLYMVVLALDMQNMNMDMSMPQMQTWGFIDFTLTFVMWAVMMVAMMIPSAAPMILTFSAINRRKHQEKNPVMLTSLFLLGYLVIWTVFSAGVTVIQWGLHSMALLSPMMVSSSPLLGGIILISAGVFQFTPYKQACLGHCRTPMGFLMTEWRLGKQGAFLMGIRHGYFCVGCCWLIMALLFVAGVMNLLWVATIAGFVLLEKVMPSGEWVSRIAGVVMTVWGVGMIFGAF
jgi:predicted metal-binding membrane protein